MGPLGRRAFTNTRLEFGWGDSASRSAIDAVTIQVNDAFTSGGAQVTGGRRTRTINLASDLDYVRSIHSVRMGVVLNAGSYHSDDSANYLGTYTFESLTAYEAGRPRSYTRRIGDPNIDYFNLQAAVYIQDDIRVRKGLTITPGLRYEAQTHLSDFNVVRPALRHHLGAVQERQDDAARERRRLHRLAEQRDLRADAAGRRPPPARVEHRQPARFPTRATSASCRRSTSTCSPTICRWRGTCA